MSANQSVSVLDDIEGRQTMSGYNLHTMVRPPTTFTAREQTSLLFTTGEHVRGWRDHFIYALALGTGLREHEVLALDVNDVCHEDFRARGRVQLRVYKESNPDPKMQQVLLSRPLRAKLEKYLKQRRERGEVVLPTTPLFPSRERDRLSERQVRTAFVRWQMKAKLERTLHFHALRHTAITNFYRKTRDLALTAIFARHRSLESTRRYTHFSDQDLEQAVELLPC
jgi:integrase/recombinase XerC